MYLTTAKFNSICASTGEKIRKGEQMYYDASKRKCYTLKSQIEADSIANMVQANEDAYFDSFCQANNI
jgi:hypothetical protein